jgi:protein SCO1/2
MTSSEAPVDKTPLYKNPFAIAFAIGVVFLTALGPLQEILILDAPEPLYDVAPWTLVDERGDPIGSETLAGKVVVANFFFTRCPSVCPKLTAAMASVALRLSTHADIAFVSFTVDAEHDTPEVLRAHKQGVAGDDPRWRYVTGAPADVRRVLVENLKMGVGEKKPIDEQGTLFDIAHQNRFMLLDQKGRVRALFDVDDDGLRALVGAARLLIRKGADT